MLAARPTPQKQNRKRSTSGEFPCGTMVRTFTARDSSIPGWGTKIPTWPKKGKVKIKT